MLSKAKSNKGNTSLHNVKQKAVRQESRRKLICSEQSEASCGVNQSEGFRKRDRKRHEKLAEVLNFLDLWLNTTFWFY